MMMKLSRNARTVGVRCCSARQSSAVLRMLSGASSFTSMMSSVSAMANTPSQNASRRALSRDSLMDGSRSAHDGLRISSLREHAGDGRDGIPVARRRGRAEQLVELTQLADRLHGAPVDAVHEEAVLSEHLEPPRSRRRKAAWQW